MSVFEVGELLVTSTPYAFAIHNHVRGRFCDFCMKENSDLKRCSQCSFLYFCDRTCQKKAWEEHKQECKLIKKAGNKKPSSFLRLFSLIMFKIKKLGEDEPFEEVHGRKVSYSMLMSNAKLIKEDLSRMVLLMELKGELKEYVGLKNVPVGDQFIEIYGKISMNLFAITVEGSEIGSGVYLGGSIFDHSCDFDAIPVFDGPILEVRMIKSVSHRNIGKVCISYIDSMNLIEDRQKILENKYYFTCQCLRCKTNKNGDVMSKLLDDSEETKIKALKCNQDLIKLQAMMNDLKSDHKKLYKYCRDALKIQDETLADMNICKVKTISYAFVVYAINKKFDEAIKLGARLYDAYRFYYGYYHDTLVYLLIQLGTMLQEQNCSTEAVAKFAEAEKILQVTHGKNHSLYRYLRLILQATKCTSSFKN